ncbi:MAG: hypothetical protein A3K65_02145 [Euryarchaeota archaeon RBG_16_68_12]|nr:MAG: hypothetical protein A3K65_02145 [Euryarchaeota archaeon RBG_16_68_12]
MESGQRDRMKYLFREILGVDVDKIVRQVVAKVAVERARKVPKQSKEWKRYMSEEGGIVFLPGTVASVGRKSSKE